MAAQLSARKGSRARGLRWCSEKATRSLPLPDSPSMSAGKAEEAYRSIWLRSLRMGGLSPMSVRASSALPGAGARSREPQDALQERAQVVGLAGLGHEVDRAQRARAAGVRLLVLAGEHDDADVRRVREEVADELEALVGQVRGGRQAQVDQREVRRPRHFAQGGDGGGAVAGAGELEVRPQHEGEAFGDQRVVVDQQQSGFHPGAGALVCGRIIGRSGAGRAGECC